CPRAVRGRPSTRPSPHGDGPSAEVHPMCATVTPAPLPASDRLHVDFPAILPRIEAHGRTYFRHLKCAHRKEEALAEMRALAWKWFVRLVQRGKDPTAFVSATAVYAAKAVHSGRRVCGHERAKD